MKFTVADIKDNIRFRLFSGSLVLFFLFKLFFTDPGSAVYQVINELLMLTSALFLFLYLMDYTSMKRINPLSLVMN
ncbi:MAG: hypothetical protein R6W90_13150, partial [Ignavibacteriaceae bacterium]